MAVWVSVGDSKSLTSAPHLSCARKAETRRRWAHSNKMRRGRVVFCRAHHPTHTALSKSDYKVYSRGGWNLLSAGRRPNKQPCCRPFDEQQHRHEGDIASDDGRHRPRRRRQQGARADYGHPAGLKISRPPSPVPSFRLCGAGARRTRGQRRTCPVRR